MTSRLPKLKEDNNCIIGSKHAVKHIDSVAGFLTCLSVEVDRNKMFSTGVILMELANSLSTTSNKIENINRWAERQIENSVAVEKKQNMKK